MSILDRLEQNGLLVRTLSEHDRRVRIPKATRAGVKVCKKVGIARDEAISDRLDAIPESNKAIFHRMLSSIVEGTPDPS